MLFIIFSFLCYSGSAFSAGDTITLKKPPEALAQWYKPANKRQVWLHTMFSLRRAMLAINDYSAQEKQADLEKWSDKFAKDYQAMGKMVPQWQDYLYLDKLKDLQQQVSQHNYTAIAPLLKKLSKSCMHCHDDYQTITTLLLRGPNFNNRSIEESFSGEKISYEDNMEQLSVSVNRINIAIKDNYFSDAQQYIEPLTDQLEHLATSCGDCHQKDEVPVQRIMDASLALLPELAAQLEAKEQKQSGRKLGEFAVKVCAKCHAIHKLPSDLQLLFN